MLLKNTTGRTEFINVRLSHLSVENNEVIEKPFKTEEFMNWPVYSTPSAVILDPGGAERVSLVRMNKDNQEDILIGVSLLPDTLSSFNNSVDISVGYKSWYLVPGKSAMVGQLDANRRAGELLLDNNTNKHLSVSIDSCENSESSNQDCESTLFLLSGASKIIPISALKGEGRKINIRYYDALKKTVKDISVS
ncbi:MAG: hypothetical protein RR721_08510 [Aeromonas sp.]|uniref:hypothetical protein n=1 Tax=Aeromonas sp. TaxID=647 RepID=UPI002FC73039